METITSARQVKGEVYNALRTALTKPKSPKSKTTWSEAFVNEMLSQAIKNPNSPMAQLIAKSILKDDILTELDANTEKLLARDADFLEYRIMKQLYKEQAEVLANESDKRILVNTSRRCFGEGTPILMADGGIKPVEAVEIGDYVMGPDSKPRRVVDTTTGYDDLYEVSTTKGDIRFVCNSKHTLVLKRTKTTQWTDHGYKVGKVYDVPIYEYMAMNKKLQYAFSLYRQRIEYTHKNHPLDPYLLGLWLGDGHSSNGYITIGHAEQELLDYIQERGGSLRNDRTSYRALIPNTTSALRKIGVLNNKHIPMDYITDSTTNRLELLAGLIDSDGYLHRDGCVEFCNTNKRLIDDVLLLAQSLGYRTAIRTKISKLYGKPCKRCWTISIKGALSEIPNRISRKKSCDSRQGTHYNFTITPKGKGRYFGFTTEGDGRILLGDYSVNHNCGKTELAARWLVKKCVRPNSNCLYIHLTFSNAIHQMFDRIVECAEKIELGIDHKSKAEGIIAFINGSCITLRGNSNKTEADKSRGYRYDGIVLEESAYQQNLKYLLEDVLTPTTADSKNSQMLMISTPPRAPKTYYEDCYRSGIWKVYEWDATKNPFIDFRAFVEETLQSKGLTEDSPFVKRELLGQFAYDTEAQVFKGYLTYPIVENEQPYQTANRLGIHPDRIYIGADWGYEDYNAIIGVAYDLTKRKGFVFAERKFNHAAVSDIVRVVREVFDKGKQLLIEFNLTLDNIGIYGDTNEKSVIYELSQTHNLPAYCAYKYDKANAISQLSEYARTALYIPEAGVLADEFERTLYKRDDQDVILPEIDDAIYHPDAIMALLYASRQWHWDLGSAE